MPNRSDTTRLVSVGENSAGEVGEVLRARGLGKKFGRTGWALRDCTFAVPRGRLTALLGANGAGKTTLLMMAAGLIDPSEGRIEVLGTAPDGLRMPDGVSFLAQDKPLYPRLRVEEMLRAASVLNTGGRWDDDYARGLIDAAGVGMRRRVGQLSPGQRARVGLALALGRRPRLLLLDEPLAELDPVARRDVFGMLLAEVTESGMTIVLSSHVISEIDDVCDHLILLRGGQLQLCGDIEPILAAHTQVTGPTSAPPLNPATIIHHTASGRQQTATVTGTQVPVGYHRTRPALEELILAYLRSPNTPTHSMPDHGGAA
jgi:ABC-2 type transport system ATP-binding protein